MMSRWDRSRSCAERTLGWITPRLPDGQSRIIAAVGPAELHVELEVLGGEVVWQRVHGDPVAAFTAVFQPDSDGSVVVTTELGAVVWLVTDGVMELKSHPGTETYLIPGVESWELPAEMQNGPA